MEFDPAGWDLAEKLPHGALYWVARSVIVAVPDDGVVETPELAQLVYDGYTRCAQRAGHPIAIVVFVDRLGDQTPQVRQFWTDVMKPDVLCCVALVCASFFSRALGGFFMGFQPPVVPTKMFATMERAVDWSAVRLAAQSDG
jgi:hypothetical protein